MDQFLSSWLEEQDLDVRGREARNPHRHSTSGLRTVRVRVFVMGFGRDFV